jgi:hypothetical protein
VALYLIEHATITADAVIIKFGRTVKISSLVNPNFTVQTTDTVPVPVPSPFAPINTITDYNQISRTLRLFWDVQLVSGQEYLIKVSNLFDAVNEVIAEEQIKFTKLDDATPSSIVSFKEPDYGEILIEDKSVRIDAFSTVQILAKNPNFYITSVQPVNGDFYIDNSFNMGRVIVTFSSRPATNFLNNYYFKAQKKKIQRQPSRWESVNCQISMHSWRPEVYIDFPSNDATPVFYSDEKEYFETGYKYRIILSKDIGI